MTVLVTGAAGFLGRHVVVQLLEQGLSVVTTGRSPSPDVDLAGDLADAAFARRLLEEAAPSHVLHLAGSVAPTSWAGHLHANAMATATLLEAAAEVVPDTWLAIASSSAVYGAALVQPITEDAPHLPRTAYAASKCAQELIAQQAERSGGLRLAILRLFNLVGPGQGPHLVAGRLASQVAEVEAGRRSEVHLGTTSPRRDFVDVRDAAAAIVGAQRASLSGTYNLATGVGTSIAELVSLFVAAAQTPVPVVTNAGDPAAADIPEQRGDSDRLRAATGWQPRRSLEESVSEMLEWSRQSIDGRR